VDIDDDPRRPTMKLNGPFAGAFEKLRRDALSRDDFDPAWLFGWGQMMAVSLLEMLKAVEARFGQEGQRTCTDALVEVGRRLALEGLEGVNAPAGMQPIEAISRFATWINQQLYASVEKPSIDGPDACSFDILWCPHQDVYHPFDCRVQRYLVEGLISGAHEKLGEAFGKFDVACDSTIPAGAPTCHFRMWRTTEDKAQAWVEYSRQLEEKALGRREAEK